MAKVLLSDKDEVETSCKFHVWFFSQLYAPMRRALVALLLSISPLKLHYYLLSIRNLK
jgi:hypothetical protein